MKSEQTRNQIKIAIEKHLRENPGGAVIVNPDGLIERILREMGLSDSIVHNGWDVRRVQGKDIRGCPKGSRHCFGFIASKPGAPIQSAPPCAGTDQPLESFLLTLDLIDVQLSMKS